MSEFILRRHYPLQVEYWASEEPVVQPAAIDVQYNIGIGYNNANPLDWRVNLTVKFAAKHEGNETVRGKIEYVGYFDVPNEIQESDRQLFVARNGASVLYSATRELVANISCRSINRHITLPIALFHDLKFDSPSTTKQIQAQIP